MGLFDWFSNRKLIEGDVVDLRERYRVDERSAYDGVPTVYYDVLNHENKEKVGTIDLRLTVEGDMFYSENIASYKTLKKLDGELIDLVKVPPGHPLYTIGEKTKYIFRYRISLR